MRIYRFLTVSLSRARSCLAVLVWLCVVSTANCVVNEVQWIGLTVSELDREVRFFTEVLSFEEVSRCEAKGRSSDDLVDLQDTRLKMAQLKLGDESIALTEHRTKGRPIPADSRSNDQWFQHIAIVVSDMDRAYAQLRKHKVKQVSTEPQTLPQWNAKAGGIKAFYFRDPEEHVLELIWFPTGKGDPKWKAATGKLFLGIDHTAMVVSDTDRSLALYRDLLGLRVAGESENYGVEQEHLNQVFGARLRITSLRAEHGPGIEFLEYITPSGGRAMPSGSQANDLIFWRTALCVDTTLAELTNKLKDSGAKLVSKRITSASADSGEAGATVIVRDPDGHALQLVGTKSTTTASAK